MKFLKFIKKFNREVFTAFYVLILLMSVSFAYQLKSNERNESLKNQNENSLIIKNSKDVRDALRNCDTNYFLKLKADDFYLISRSETLDDSWKEFFNEKIAKNTNVIEINGCIQILSTLATHNITTNYVYVIYDLKELEKNTLKKIIESGIISEMILDAVANSI